jgi:hypothetical protein
LGNLPNPFDASVAGSDLNAENLVAHIAPQSFSQTVLQNDLHLALRLVGCKYRETPVELDEREGREGIMTSLTYRVQGYMIYLHTELFGFSDFQPRSRMERA